jgi:hypothetical protein
MAIIHARDIDIKIRAASSLTFANVAALRTAFNGAQVVATAKSLDLDEGEHSFDQQDYLGEDSNGYQNQAKIRKPKGKPTLTFTADVDDMKAIIQLLKDTNTSLTTGENLYADGNAARRTVDVLVDFNNGSESWLYVLKAAEQTKPMIKVTGVDGEVEHEFELSCLARDLVGPVIKE